MFIMLYLFIAAFASLSAIIAYCAVAIILRTKLAAAFADAPGHRKVHSAPVPRVGGIAIIAATKLAASAALAAVTVFGFGVHPNELSAFGLFTLPAAASKIIAALWIVALINAYNLVDGLDGFAATVSAVSLVGIAAAACILVEPESIALCLIALGATLGFLAHNAPPAKAFMGDTGSCFLGYVIALLTIHTATT